MNDPHKLLGLSHDATEAETRRRYLELVREFPPDRAPERFAEIRAAFDQLRDPATLLSRRLFSLSTDDSLDALHADLVGRMRTARLPYAVLLSVADKL